jgi:uncharacterized protein YndB with AHSA1/START domain
MTEAATTRELTITRVFDAPRESVWKAWTEPDHLARWWGRRGWNAQRSTLVMDVRPGGRFRVTSVCEADGSKMTNEGVYREVVAPERLVFGDGADGRTATVTLTDLADGRTEMVFTTMIEASEQLRDTAAAGMRSAFDRLAEQLT